MGKPHRTEVREEEIDAAEIQKKYKGEIPGDTL
jgi:hypothetical protein